ARHVPRRKPGTWMPEHLYPVETGRPVVEILLVSESPCVRGRKAPLEAACPPPLERREATIVTAESEPLDVVDPVGRLLTRPLRRIPVGDDLDRVGAELAEERLR